MLELRILRTKLFEDGHYLFEDEVLQFRNKPDDEWQNVPIVEEDHEISSYGPLRRTEIA